MALTNATLWNTVRDRFPQFKSQTAKATADLFTEKGFEQLANNNTAILNEFMGLSIRVFLQKINVADVKDLLENQDMGESYSNESGGGISQRIAIESSKPISSVPIVDGSSSDPFVARLGDTKERFFDQNFDYASLITIPDRALIKNMFMAEDGMSSYVAGLMKALENGYKLQKYLNKLEALNAGLHSETFPLKATQQYETAALTDSASIISFIELVRNIVDAMVYNPATAAFNSYGFESTQDKDRLRLLIRPELKNKLATISRLNSPEDMSLPIKTVVVDSFGGMRPAIHENDVFSKGTIIVKEVGANGVSYADMKAGTFNADAFTITSAIEAEYTVVKDIYDALGTKVAYAFTNTTETAVIYIPCGYNGINVAKYDDPNADILAIIIDKGAIFTMTQNPYQVEAIRNPRPYSYTNYFAKTEHNSIKFDFLYNIATISKSS